MRVDGPRPAGPEWLEQRIGGTAREDGRRPAEPHVRLGIGALGAQAVVHLLRAHVQPAHVDVRMELLEAPLEQREEIAAVGTIDHQRSAGIPRAGE